VSRARPDVDEHFPYGRVTAGSLVSSLVALCFHLFAEERSMSDAVESAKIRQKPKQPVAAPPLAVAQAPEPPQADAEPPMPIVALPKPRRFRVLAECQVSVNGCLTHLMAGQVVDAAIWGKVAVDSLVTQVGGALEEIV
jgi:hypothetical protein